MRETSKTAQAAYDQVQQQLRGLPSLAKELMAGGVAGGLSKTSVAPLERVKILFQTGQMHGTGVGSTLLHIYQTEGTLGFFKGNGASVLRIVPYAALNFTAYEHLRNLLALQLLPATSAHQEPDSFKVPPWLDLLAGSAAGAASTFVTYPLDFVRTRLAYQTRGLPNLKDAPEQPHSFSSGGGDNNQSTAKSSHSPSSPRAREQHASQHFQRPRAPDRSCSSTSASHQLHTAASHTWLPCQAQPKSFPGSSWQHRCPSNANGGRLSCLHAAAAHATASSSHSNSAAAISMGPQQLPHQLPRTISAMLVTTIQQEGILGLYRGLGPSLAGILPYAGLKFYVYQTLKQQYAKVQTAEAEALAHSQVHRDVDGPDVHCQEEQHSPHKLPVLVSMSFGAIAGLAAQTVTFPLDVVRRQMQVQGLQQGQPNGQPYISSTLHGLLRIVRQHGWAGLFRGLSINYMKVVPTTAIGFAVYDGMKGYLALPRHM